MTMNEIAKNIRERVKWVLTLVLVVAPCPVFADCKITDSPYKFEVVCSGKESAANSTPPASGNKAGKTKSTTIDARTVIVMSEEEHRIMESRNKLDGDRIKRKSGKVGKKTGAGQQSNT